MKYFIWGYHTNQSRRFFKCGLKSFEGSSRIPWNSGVRIDFSHFPNVLEYISANNLNPDDYVMTSGPQFLISRAVVDCLKKLNIEGVDYYPSEIRKPSGEILEGFSTIIITVVIDCIDKESSEFTYEEFGPAKIIRFNKLYLDHSRIPQDTKMFRLKEKETAVIVNEEVKNFMEGRQLSGLKFTPIEEFVDFV